MSPLLKTIRVTTAMVLAKAARDESARARRTAFRVFDAQRKRLEAELERVLVPFFKKQIASAVEKMQLSAKSEKCGGRGGKPGPCPDPLAKLNKTQRNALQDYSTDKFQQVNSALRTGKLDKATKRIVDGVDSALRTAEKRPGSTVRSFDIPSGTEGDSIRKMLQSGGTFTDAAYVSTRKIPTATDRAAFVDRHAPANRVVMRVEGKSGVDISSVSKNPGEGEVLYPRGTKFNVDKVVHLDNGSILAMVSEIGNQKGEKNAGGQENQPTHRTSPGIESGGRRDFGWGLGSDWEGTGQKGIGEAYFTPAAWDRELIQTVFPVIAKASAEAGLAGYLEVEKQIANRGKSLRKIERKVFCATGPGGGVDATCKPGQSSGDSTLFRNAVSPKEFLDAKGKSTRDEFLSHITEDDIRHHKLILTKDGKAGAAVSPNGDIQNVFNNGGPKGIGQEVLLEAVKRGGATLDCYAGFLPGYYSNFGFVETGRMKFNREYAPSNWDYEKYGEPDVVFMGRAKKEPEHVIRERFEQWSRFGKSQPEPSERIYQGDEWDQAKTDSGRVVSSDGSRKEFGTKADGSRDYGRNRGVSSGDRRTIKASTATDWLIQEGLDVPDEQDFVTPYGKVTLGFLTEYPEWLKKRIEAMLAETFSMPYWSGINQTTGGDIDRLLTEGLVDGKSIEQMASEMESLYGSSSYPMQRGRLIARTESGNALNGSRSSVIDGLIQDLGMQSVIKKIWLSVLGNTTRDTHANLDSVPAGSDGCWWLGGIRARWPGDVRLKASERANCQCTVFTMLGMQDDEAADLISEYDAREAARLKKSFAAEKTKHEYASTQFDLEDAGCSRSQGNPIFGILPGMANRIPDGELAEDGRETEFHITVKFGLHDHDPMRLVEVVRGFGSVRVRLGKTSIFPAKEGADYDVVKIDVEGEDLHRLNKLITDSVPNTTTHPTYRPHITLAYVKAGLGEKYAGNIEVEGFVLDFDVLTFSDKNRNHFKIDLERPVNGIRKQYAEFDFHP